MCIRDRDDAVDKIAKAIRRNRVGLGTPNRPIGSFLFVGPTGVGKTELSKQLAIELFGSADSMIRFDMSEYCLLYTSTCWIVGCTNRVNSHIFQEF